METVFVCTHTYTDIHVHARVHVYIYTYTVAEYTIYLLDTVVWQQAQASTNVFCHLLEQIYMQNKFCVYKPMCKYVF